MITFLATVHRLPAQLRSRRDWHHQTALASSNICRCSAKPFDEAIQIDHVVLGSERRSERSIRRTINPTFRQCRRPSIGVAANVDLGRLSTRFGEQMQRIVETKDVETKDLDAYVRRYEMFRHRCGGRTATTGHDCQSTCGRRTTPGFYPVAIETRGLIFPGRRLRRFPCRAWPVVEVLSVGRYQSSWPGLDPAIC